MLKEGFGAGEGLLAQAFWRGAASGFDRRKDAPTGSQNFEIRFALQAQLELGGAISGPDQVGMRINQSRQRYLTSGVKSRFVRVSRTQIGTRAHISDGFTLDEHGPIPNDTQAAQFCAALGSACQGQKLGNRMDQHTPVFF